MFFLSSINKRFLHYLSSEKRERGRVIFLNMNCSVEKKIDALLKHQTIERRRDLVSINGFIIAPNTTFMLISDGSAALRWAM